MGYFCILLDNLVRVYSCYFRTRYTVPINYYASLKQF